MARAFLFLSLGILVARFLQVAASGTEMACYIATANLLVIILLETFVRMRAKRLSAYLLWIEIALIGFILMAQTLPDAQDNYFQKLTADRLIGVISDEPVRRGNSVRFPLQLCYAVNGDMATPARGEMMVSIALPDSTEDYEAYLKANPKNYAYGDQLIFESKVSDVPPAYNPLQFDYKTYLANKNIYSQGYYKDAEVSILARDQGRPLVAWALRLRAHLVAKFQRLLKQEEALQLSSALILGYRADFSTEILQLFSSTGTIHVLSVSGLHVGVVFYLLNWLLKFMARSYRWALVRSVIILLVIWLYVLLTGMAPAILRAGLMISVFILAELFLREQSNLNTLFLSALIILLWQPHMLFDVGFQLSYMAVVGLFTLYPLMVESFPMENKYMKTLQQYIFISIAAQLFTASLSLYYFHQFPSYFLLGNLFIALPSTLLMFAGLSLALSPIAWLNGLAAQAIDLLSSFLLDGLKLIEQLPYALVRGVDLSLIEVLLASFLIALLLFSWLYRSKTALWGTASVSFLLIVSSSAKALQLSAFRGLMIYNVQRDIAFAFIDRERVFLYTNLDSLSHRKLRFQVWPDLERYCTIKQVQYQQIAPLRGKAMLVDALGLRLGIAEQLQDLPDRQDCDLLIYRGAHREDFDQLRQKMRRTLLILDGANSSLQLQAFQAHADSLGQAYYILKDNFSYVWEKQN